MGHMNIFRELEATLAQSRMSAGDTTEALFHVVRRTWPENDKTGLNTILLGILMTRSHFDVVAELRRALQLVQDQRVYEVVEDLQLFVDDDDYDDYDESTEIPADDVYEVDGLNDEVSLAPAVRQNNDIEVGTCCVCYSRESVVLCKPCGHVCMCEVCANQWTAKNNTCPVCRASLTGASKLEDDWLNKLKEGRHLKIGDKPIILSQHLRCRGAAEVPCNRVGLQELLCRLRRSTVT